MQLEPINDNIKFLTQAYCYYCYILLVCIVLLASLAVVTTSDPRQRHV
uniref:Uncharacterized protein n=1 Tax=Amphimedon queenslandica TaxID=400682 RepID=A0A1X7SLZ6_AMPQE